MEWVVSGFILGDVLPVQSLRLGPAEIHRRRPGEKGTHFKPTNVSAVLEGSPNFRSVTYGRVEVFSEWIVNFTVEAPSAQDAVELVDQVHLPPVQAALEISFESRYFNEVAKQALLDPGDDSKREAVLDQLADALKASTSTRRKVAQIRSAVTELNLLEKTFLTPRIRAAASELRLSEDVTEETIEFLKLRNAKLGHTGAAVDREELGRWLEDGRRLAIDFLDAYVEWRSS